MFAPGDALGAGRPLLSDLPGFLPGIAVSLVVSTAASGPAARVLGLARWRLFAVFLALGVILSATLTPFAPDMGSPAEHAGSCNFTLVGPASWTELLGLGEVSGNVLLFVPLGASVGWLPLSRLKIAFVVAAMALPFAIEATQSLVPLLGRSCEAADVVNNLTGLFVGVAAGTLGGRLVRGRTAPPAATGLFSEQP